MSGYTTQQVEQTSGSYSGGYFSKHDETPRSGSYTTQAKETSEIMSSKTSGYSQRQARIVKSRYVRK